MGCRFLLLLCFIAVCGYAQAQLAIVGAAAAAPVIDTSKIRGYPYPRECTKYACKHKGCKPEVADEGIYCHVSNKCYYGPGECVKGECVSKYKKPCPDHKDECKAYECDPYTGECTIETPVKDKTPCKGGKCYKGKCVKKPTIKRCTQPEDPCKVSTYDKKTKECVESDADYGTKCDDHDACTYHDICVKGECKGTPKNCNDYNGNYGKNGCKTYTCNSDSGKCEEDNVEDGTDCEDEFFCTVDGKCHDGECKGEQRDCDEEKGGDSYSKGGEPKYYCDEDKNECVEKGDKGCKRDKDCKGEEYNDDCNYGKCRNKKCVKTPKKGNIDCDDDNDDTCEDKCYNGECKGYKEKCPECHEDKDCEDEDDDCNEYKCYNGKCKKHPKQGYNKCSGDNDCDGKCYKGECKCH